MTGAKKHSPADKAKSEARKARLAAELRANLLKRKAKGQSQRKLRGIGMRGDRVKGKGVDWTVGRGLTGARAEDGGLRKISNGAGARGSNVMDRIRIVGGKRLTGTIPISGAKNAALPLMIASLLTRETVTLHNVPRLADVNLLGRILGNHGVDVTIAGKRPNQRSSDGQTFRLTATEIVDTTAPYEMVARMRASFWVLAPLVARCGRARVSLPGGCAIGTRPVDLHLTTLASARRRDRARRRLCQSRGRRGA